MILIIREYINRIICQLTSLAVSIVIPYYILEVVHNTETYGIYIPCYELPVFEELTGLRAE